MDQIHPQVLGNRFRGLRVIEFWDRVGQGWSANGLGWQEHCYR